MRPVTVRLSPSPVVAVAFLLGLLAAEGLVAQSAIPLREATSPGSNMIMTVPYGWRFLTSAEQGRDSMTEIGTLVGTLISPDSGTIVFVERMNRTYAAADMARRIEGVGLNRYCEGIIDSIMGREWDVATFVEPPFFRETPMEFRFGANIARPSPTQGDSVGVMRFFYRKVGGIDVRIHSISGPNAYAPAADAIDTIMTGARSIVDEADDSNVMPTGKSRMTEGERETATGIIVGAIILAIIAGVIVWRVLRRKRRSA